VILKGLPATCHVCMYVCMTAKLGDSTQRFLRVCFEHRQNRSFRSRPSKAKQKQAHNGGSGASRRASPHGSWSQPLLPLFLRLIELEVQKMVGN
jgi:hypothetical protein